MDDDAGQRLTPSEGEERYRILFEHAPDAIVVVDCETGRFVDANPNASLLFGLEREELLKFGPAELSPETQPDGRTSAEAAADLLRRALAGESPMTEWTHVNATGDLISCEVRLVRLPPFSRQLVRGSVIDISERKRTEAELARSEREFRSLAEHSPDWIVRVDRELRRTYVNPAVERGSGTAAKDLLGKTPSESFPDSRVLREWEAALAEVIRTGQPQQLETPAELNGSRHLQTAIVPDQDDTGHILGALSITRDVTSVRRAREAEMRLAAIVESASDAIMSSDLAGQITSWNKGAERMFGWTEPEVLGRTTEFLFQGDSSGDERTKLRDRLLAGETVSDYVRTWHRKDGSEVTTASILFPLLDSEGTMVGTASVARDITEERAAAEAILRSEERLRHALESAHMGTWRYHLATDTMEFSEQAAEIYHRPLSEMPKTMREALALFHPDDTRPVRDRLSGREAMPAAPREYRIRMPGGEYRWMSGIGQLVDSKDDTISGLILDIHDRKIAELALRDSEEQLKAVVDSVSAGIWVFDGQEILLVNAAAERLTGYSRDRLGSLDSLKDLLGEEGAKALITRANSRLAGEDIPSRYELTIRTYSGESRTVELTGTRIAFRGKPAVIISAFDVTARHASQAALLASESLFRSLVDNSPDFITRIDRDLRHEFVNRTAEREAGLDPAKVLGKRADEMGFDSELAQVFLARQQQVRESGEAVEYEYAIHSIATPNQVAYRRARVVPEMDEQGTVHHILSIVTDITAQRVAEEARKRLDQQMQHAQKLESLGVLAGGIAHDFNNLLVAILGNAGLALMELGPESPARQTVQQIEVAAQRAAELTRQMLAYSGKGKFVIEPLNLSRVVGEMAHLLEVSVSKRAALRYRFADALPTVEGDATQIRQVIMNLILNASDAIGEAGGTITISTGVMHADTDYLSGPFTEAGLPEGTYVFLEVSDNGSGMDAETSARIFDPFFSTKFTGRGLGLAAVLGIVRGHQGAIKLYSELGRGTTFKVLFPAVESRERPESVSELLSESPAAAGRTILVVDDDRTVRAVTQRILEHAGFRVALAEDGSAGLEAYAANPGIALVLLDMTMPQMDGEEAFRELRRLDPNVKVLLTSGYSEQDATESFAGKGLAGFIQKPYRPQELLGRIFDAIGDDAS